MSKHIIKYDISAQYTKKQNECCGRKGYYGFKKERIKDISPKDYGMFIERKRIKK